MRKEFRDLAPPEEAARVIAELDLGGGTEDVPLTAAGGRVLAERIDATIDVPGFDRAQVDGYAVRAADTYGAGEATPTELDLAGVVHAGERPDVAVDEGAAVEISTGAVLPDGADAVVMVERTERTDDSVAVRTGVAPGDGVMVAGADVAAGDRALGPGRLLTPREVALLSAMGRETVPVVRAPTVAIVSTGDELVRPGDALDSDAGQIYDVNSYTIASSVAEAGGEPVLYPHAGDDRAEMERVLREAADECDLVLSSGSTSAGAVDVLYRVIEDEGTLRLHGVAVKPGKPMLIGELADSAFVGLPGFPVSALTIFRIFVAPAIREAAGLPERRTQTVHGRMALSERYREGRTRYMPVGLVEDGAGEVLVYPVDKGSGATTSLVDADGIVEIDPDTEQLDAGSAVDVQLFSPDVRPPGILGMGEDDPLFSRLLDRLERPRYLSVGSREGSRRLRKGIPDVAVVTGPARLDVEATELGGWSREWGLVVPGGNPDDVSGLADLVDRELTFVNRDQQSGLRASMDAALESLADERGVTLERLSDAISGFSMTARAVESPARRVEEGKAAVGLGLRATATKLGLGFVPVGRQDVGVLANPDRTGKSSVRALAGLLPPAGDLAAEFDGFDVGSDDA